MNYLAHLALSHDNSDTMLGNFIGDFVKGSNYNSYSPAIRTGILLHRKIDAFTDLHPLVKESMSLLKEPFGRYSGIMVDMFYDHFLAANWQEFRPDIPLNKFVNRVHKILMFNYFRLPGDVKKMLPFLIKSRRLEKYANITDLGRALNIMSRNTTLPNNTNEAIRILKENYATFEMQFRSFYPDVVAMVDTELINVQHDAENADYRE
ncbi:MAG: DUF479 domain-containing protein [Marinilabiliaceae bacterium]|nr:DUF479 domain-containing protein [Marinilabiliaceae bacterium]